MFLLSHSNKGVSSDALVLLSVSLAEVVTTHIYTRLFTEESPHGFMYFFGISNQEKLVVSIRRSHMASVVVTMGR